MYLCGMNRTATLRRTFDSAHPIVMGLIGAVVIAGLTQVRIPLPFTPVPITGQTFAVILWPLLFGRTVGMMAVGTYLAAGLLGAPVFSGFTAMSALWGPTSGYLIGFLASAAVVGTIRDNYLLAMERSVLRAVVTTLTIIVATAIILGSGAMVLASFVGIENVWTMGVAPFLGVDVIKTILLLTSVEIARWTTRN